MSEEILTKEEDYTKENFDKLAQNMELDLESKFSFGEVKEYIEKLINEKFPNIEVKYTHIEHNETRFADIYTSGKEGYYKAVLLDFKMSLKIKKKEGF